MPLSHQRTHGLDVGQVCIEGGLIMISYLLLACVLLGLIAVLRILAVKDLRFIQGQLGSIYSNICETNLVLSGRTKEIEDTLDNVDSNIAFLRRQLDRQSQRPRRRTSLRINAKAEKRNITCWLPDASR